jgi:glycine cleavage system H lipoate-binding protein
MKKKTFTPVDDTVIDKNQTLAFDPKIVNEYEKYPQK